MRKNKELTFIDFFAGVGGFRLGFEEAGFKCVGFCENDKYALKSYRAIFDTKEEWYRDDINKIKAREIPYADIWCGGTPCQDVSIAGARKGLSGDRSGLFFKFIELLKVKDEKDKPTFIILENVKGLLSSHRGFDFTEYLHQISQAGYDGIWQVLNSKDFGVPQNRERVFFIGYLRSRGRREILPITGENQSAIKQVVGGCQGNRILDPKGISCTLTGNGGGWGGKTGLYYVGNINPSGRGMNGKVYSSKGIAPTLTTNKGEGSKVLIDGSLNKPTIKVRNGTKKGYDEAGLGDGISLAYPKSKTRRGRVGKGVAQTLDTSCMQGTLTKNSRIRRLTPRECFRLQGFPDELFNKIKDLNSDSQLYKQAGNAVTANVAYEVALSIKNSIIKGKA